MRKDIDNLNNNTSSQVGHDTLTLNENENKERNKNANSNNNVEQQNQGTATSTMTVNEQSKQTEAFDSSLTNNQNEINTNNFFTYKYQVLKGLGA